MAYSNPSVDDFKAMFTRAFPYNADPTLGVTDADISSAYLQVNGAINQCLFPSQEAYSPSYMYLAAHFLTLMLRASAGGVNAGGATFLTQSKSVGSVSESYAIPQSILNNPLWSAYMTTPWGQAYLNSIMPFLTGFIFAVPGRTQP